MTHRQEPEKQVSIDIASSIMSSVTSLSRVHLNVAQEVVITTEDRLKLWFSKHVASAEKRRGWIAPLGLLAPIVTALVTSTFRDVGLAAAVWEAMFFLVGLFALCWLAVAVIQACRSESVEDIVATLKKGLVVTGEGPHKDVDLFEEAQSSEDPFANC